MATPFIQTAFAAGELSPSLFGQVEQAKYAIGLSTARNGFISYRGGFYSRAGTAFVGFSKQTGRTVPPRLVTFQFNINQGLALEFGNFYMRVVSDGSFVIDLTRNITAITKASPGVFTSAGHTFSNGDWIDLSAILGMVELNGLTGIVANAATNTFTLTDVYGTAINTTTYGTYTSGGTATRIFELATPWAEADLSYLKWTQSADVMSICCWNQISGTSYPPYDLKRFADDNWTVTQFAPGATILPPINLSAVARSSSLLSTWYSYAVTSVDASTGEESISSAAVNVENNDISLNAGVNLIGWDAQAGASSYNVYKAPPSYGEYPSASVSYGFMATALGQNATDSNFTPDYTVVPPLHDDPFAIGAIDDVIPTAGGINYSQQTIGYTITTATGSDFDGSPVVVNGSFAGFVIRNHGHDYDPADTIALTDSGGGVSTGNYVVVTNAADGDKIILNGVTITFRRPDAAPAYSEVTLGNSIALTLLSLANFCNSSNNINLNIATYTADPTHLFITYKTPGSDGNTYSLGTAPVGWTKSGGTLSGGGTHGTGATATLTIGKLSGTYPSVPAYFQQRRVYAGSPNDPDTYWMSQSGQFGNFDSRIPPIGSDSITGTPWSLQVNGIQWLIPMPGGLVVLNGLSAWQLTGSGGGFASAQPITPTDQEALQQGYNGASATVPPIQIGSEINYVQAKGSILRDISYNLAANIYTGVDLTYLSSHLFTGYTINEMAWCEEPNKLIWATRSDGVLLSLTYLKAQDVMAWARHDTNGQFWSVCSVTEPPVDALYLGTQRYPGGHNAYMIERMDNRIWQSVEDCWCIDCGLSLTQPMPNAMLTASSSRGAGIPTGVAELIGGASYSPATTATINDPTGSGAAVVLTIAGGVITGAIIAGGSNYSYPVLVFTDPNGTGSGASGVVTLNNHATFVSSSAVFFSGDVGSVIRMGGGIATITAFGSATSVTAQITSPIIQTIPNSAIFPAPLVPVAARAGSWSLTVPTSTIRGLQYLEGAIVTGTADGKPISPRTVSGTGSVTLDAPASAVTLGYGFTVQAQSLYMNAGLPTVQGRRKKIAAVTARLEASYVPGSSAGCNKPDGSTLSPSQIAPAWPGLVPLQLHPDEGLPPYGSSVAPLWTGDVRVPISGGFATPGQTALQQSAPLPLQILAFIPEMLEGDIPEQNIPPRHGRG